MSYHLAIATPADLEQLEPLIQGYVQNHLSMAQWGGSLERLLQDYAAGYVQLMLVRCEGHGVGFGAWESSYDLHHCVRGAAVIDLYVQPQFRCRSLGNSPREMLRGMPTREMNYEN